MHFDEAPARPNAHMIALLTRCPRHLTVSRPRDLPALMMFPPWSAAVAHVDEDVVRSLTVATLGANSVVACGRNLEKLVS